MAINSLLPAPQLDPRTEPSNLLASLPHSGVVVAIVLFTLLSSVIPKGTGGPSPIGAVIKIIVGALLLFLALKQWRARPAKGEQPTMPNGCRRSTR